MGFWNKDLFADSLKPASIYFVNWRFHTRTHCLLDYLIIMRTQYAVFKLRNTFQMIVAGAVRLI